MSGRLGRIDAQSRVAVRAHQGIGRDQTAPAGPIPAGAGLHAGRLREGASFSDFSPRFGVAYDLFGNGKTALKANFGKYVQSFSSNLGDDYNPMGGGTDTRTWRDLNGDDIAQENELGASTNLNFGKPANVTTPDPDLKRPYQLLYSAGVQQELLPGLSGSVNYYYRKYYHDFWVDNLVTTHADYSIIPIADPRGNGETIPIYSIAPAKLGVIDNDRYNSTENGREYHGIDFSLNARLQRHAAAGRHHDGQAARTHVPGGRSEQAPILRCLLPVPDSVQIEWHLSAAVWIPAERVVTEPAGRPERARCGQRRQGPQHPVFGRDGRSRRA